MTNNLIIGTATGYQPRQISIFLQSLQQTGYDGDICLLVASEDRDIHEWLRGRGVIPLAVDLTGQGLPRMLRQRRFNGGRMHHLRTMTANVGDLPVIGRGLLKIQWSLIQHWLHIMFSRYWHYLRFLTAHPGRWNRILVTDVRDVYFERDPFSCWRSDGLVLFQEAVKVPLSTERHNREWIDFLYGHSVLAALSQFPVLCAGTTLGTEEAVVAYLSCMCRELARQSPRLVGRDGYDQGIHNYLARTNRLGTFEIQECFAGVVATLQSVPFEQLRFDSEGRLLNHDNTVVPVVHQFDRHPELAVRVSVRFG